MSKNTIIVDDGYTDAPPEVAEAIRTAEPIADFLPSPDELGRTIKRPVSLRLDPDVLEWFRGLGKGYQTRINSVLRAYMEYHGREEQ